MDKNGGISFSFPDHPSCQPTLLRWTEITSVQLFVEHYRGDLRPQIDLKERNRTLLYCDELREKFTVVKDNPLQMLELLVAFERRKSKILQRQIKSMGDSAKRTAESDLTRRELVKQEFSTAVETELRDQRLQNFAAETDLTYKDAWWAHYSGPQRLDRLVGEAASEGLYENSRKP